MKTHWITTMIVCLALAFGLAALGCDDGDDTTGSDDAVVADKDVVGNEDDATVAAGDSLNPTGDVAEDTTRNAPDYAVEADEYAIGPPEDTYEPPPEDILEPPPEDVVEPPEDLVVPPADIVEPPEDCGGQGPCPDAQECCDLAGQKMCMDECPAIGEGCTSDEECPGQVCCEGLIPGMGGECKDTCEGGGGIPTCETNDDCVGGQTCKDIMGFIKICLSECASDDDCDGTCQELGAMGFNLAQVCDCIDDQSCGEGLLCCALEIPMMGAVNTCLVECIDVGELLPF